ncbi:MAG: polyprenyl synthetase family protein [Candidatus Omnitrophota bacterium]|nr:MAG: polyprenyl synthetase family protein [Candidatus Omnitrophota bacterium]
MKLTKYIRGRQKLIDNKLKTLIPEANRFPSKIYQAMHYCIIGGKRIRPVLCMASSKICGGKEKNAITAACAIEMLHTYSLIHDDLPSMDNDDYRRGRPSCHRKFNEAIAILTGDAFLTLAYNILSEATKDADINNRIIKELSDVTGTNGMIGGQVVDIQNSKSPADLPTMEYIATHKTGALIAASCKTGAIIAKALRKDEEAIFKYGEYVGFAFQIIDDMLDNEGIVKIFGRKGAYNRARALVNRAKEQLVVFDKGPAYRQAGKKPLIDLADFILERKK